MSSQPAVCIALRSTRPGGPENRRIDQVKAHRGTPEIRRRDRRIRPSRRAVGDHDDMHPSAVAVPDPAAVLDAFGIAGRAVELVELPGASLNRVYRLTTDSNRDRKSVV